MRLPQTAATLSDNGSLSAPIPWRNYVLSSDIIGFKSIRRPKWQMNTAERHLQFTSGGRLLRIPGPATTSNSAFFIDRKSTRLNSSHLVISYAVFCLKKKNT